MKRRIKSTSNQNYGKNLTWGPRSITNSEVPFNSIQSRISKASSVARAKTSYYNPMLDQQIAQLRYMPDARYYNGSGFVAAFALIHDKRITINNWENVRTNPEYFGLKQMASYTNFLQDDVRQELRTEKERYENLVRQCALIYRYVCFYMNNLLRNQGLKVYEETPSEVQEEFDVERYIEEYEGQDFLPPEDYDEQQGEE